MFTPNHTFDTVKIELSNIPHALTAGGAGDNTLIDGEIIDRLGFDEAIIAMAITATLALSYANAMTISVVVNTSDSSTFATSSSYATCVTVSIGTAVSLADFVDTISWQIPLQGADRYIKVNTLADAAGGTITAVIGSVCVLSNATEAPTGQANYTAVTLV
jgi:hypothetical protein